MDFGSELLRPGVAVLALLAAGCAVMAVSVVWNGAADDVPRGTPTSVDALLLFAWSMGFVVLGTGAVWFWSVIPEDSLDDWEVEFDE